LNYEYIIADLFASRIGISYLRIEEANLDKSLNFIGIPVTTTFLRCIVNTSHCFEIGGGANLLTVYGNINQLSNETSFYILPVAVCGYRYKSVNGIMIKASFSLFTNSSFITL